MKKILLSALIVCMHLLPLKSEYPVGPAARMDFELCGGNMKCKDGSQPWDDGPLQCCPYEENSIFCCRKDQPFVCFVKQVARHVMYQVPNHMPCCYNCPMGTGKYYGISDSSEMGSAEQYGKSAVGGRANVHSSSQENSHKPGHDFVVMKADNNGNAVKVIETTSVPATTNGAVTPISESKVIPVPTNGPQPGEIDDSNEQNSDLVFEACKVKRLATYYLDENTVCCVGAGSSQCCLKDRTDLCSTDAFGQIEPIRGLNREVLNTADFTPDCSTRRAPIHAIAFLRPAEPQQIQLIGASVRVSQVEGCNVRILMSVHTNVLPAGYDYAFHVGNNTQCGDANDNAELLVTLPVNERHERFKVPSSVASVRDLRGNSLSVFRMDKKGGPQIFACGRFL